MSPMTTRQRQFIADLFGERETTGIVVPPLEAMTTKMASEMIGQPVTMLVKSTHAVLEVPLDQLGAARTALSHLRPAVKVMSADQRSRRQPSLPPRPPPLPPR